MHWLRNRRESSVSSWDPRSVCDRTGLRNNDQKPNRNRSNDERLGALRRERLMTKSCCFMSRLSAMIAFAPPGPRSLAIVASRWRRSVSRSFMAGKGRDACVQEQDCLSDRFRVTITNSPPTACLFTHFMFLARRVRLFLPYCCAPAAQETPQKAQYSGRHWRTPAPPYSHCGVPLG